MGKKRMFEVRIERGQLLKHGRPGKAFLAGRSELPCNILKSVKVLQIQIDIDNFLENLRMNLARNLSSSISDWYIDARYHYPAMYGSKMGLPSAECQSSRSGSGFQVWRTRYYTLILVTVLQIQIHMDKFLARFKINFPEIY